MELTNSLQTGITFVKADGRVNYTVFRFLTFMTQILLFCQIPKDSVAFQKFQEAQFMYQIANNGGAGHADMKKIRLAYLISGLKSGGLYSGFSSRFNST